MKYIPISRLFQLIPGLSARICIDSVCSIIGETEVDMLGLW